MTVNELMARLSKLDGDQQVMVMDGFNGGGRPRELNFGPVERLVTEEHADDTADCEELVGQKVVVVGFGCY